MSSRPNIPFDGHRGKGPLDQIGGWWIPLSEAHEICSEAWWLLPNLGVQVKQHDPDGPRDKCIWLWHGGDMYLGPWKKKGPRGLPVEHGYGAYYRHSPVHQRGLMNVGQRKDGVAHGKGHYFWLESSEIWINNYLHGSLLTESPTNRATRVPFTYKGQFRNCDFHDKSAVVTLKDGTTKVGPWENGKPVGNWWKDHKAIETRLLPLATTELCNEDTCSEPEKEEEEEEENDDDKESRRNAKPAAVKSKGKRTICSNAKSTAQRKKTKVSGTQATPEVASCPIKEESSDDDKEEQDDQGDRKPYARKVTPEKLGRRRGLNASTRRNTAVARDANSGAARKRGTTKTVLQTQQTPRKYINDRASRKRKGAASNRRASHRGHANKTDPEIIVLDSDDDTTNEDIVVVKKEGGTANENNDAEEQRRIHEIAIYLTKDLIGSNPNPVTMTKYAKQLYKRGLDSVQMIQDHLEPEDVVGMAPAHKRIVLGKLNS